MDSPVHISFRYTENEYVRALRVHHGSPLRLWLEAGGAAVLAGVGTFFWQSAGTRWLGLVCVIVAVLFILLLIAALIVVPALVFRREAKFRDEYALTFSEEGVHFRTANIDSKLQWKMYSHALVVPDFCLLYYGTRQFTVIPRRAFAALDQAQAFDQLLRQHVAKIIARDN